MFSSPHLYTSQIFPYYTRTIQTAMGLANPSSNEVSVRSTADVSLPLRNSLAQECINMLKLEFPLTPEDEADIQSFSEGDKLQSNIMLYGRLLGTHTLVRKCKPQAAQPQAAYTLSRELSNSIQEYSYRFGLSPYLKRYSVPWDNVVMAAMREGGIENLPPPSDTVQMNVILAEISGHCIKVRYNIRKVLEYSLGKTTKNITAEDRILDIITIARILVASCSVGEKRVVAITDELLQRLALLRAIYVQHEEEDSLECFWSFVDQKLSNCSREYPTPPRYQAYLDFVLRVDLEEYSSTDVYSDLQDPIIDYDEVSESQKIADKQALMIEPSR